MELIGPILLISGFLLLLAFVLRSGRTIGRGSLFPSTRRTDDSATYWREVTLLILLALGSFLFVTAYTLKAPS